MNFVNYLLPASSGIVTPGLAPVPLPGCLHMNPNSFSGEFHSHYIGSDGSAKKQEPGDILRHHLVFLEEKEKIEKAVEKSGRKDSPKEI
jgi:hypothetical protein